jgi:hypothetical protein
VEKAWKRPWRLFSGSPVVWRTQFSYIDSPAVKAHRSAAGAKKGAKAMPATKRSAVRAVGAPPRSTRSATNKAARKQRSAVEVTQSLIWWLYADLMAWQRDPCPRRAAALIAR